MCLLILLLLFEGTGLRFHITALGLSCHLPVRAGNSSSRYPCTYRYAGGSVQRQTLICIISWNHCGLPMSRSCGFVTGFQNVYFQYLSVTQRLFYVFCSPILPSLTDTLIYVLIHALGISVMALNKIVKK